MSYIENMEKSAINLPLETVRRAETIAAKENRSVGELLNDALLQYERRAWWDEMNTFGQASAERAGVHSEADLLEAIHVTRRDRRSSDK